MYPRPPKICTARSITRPAASEAVSLTIAALACRSLGDRPASASHATWWVSIRHRAISQTLSAIIAPISWCDAMRAPDCTRSLAQSDASDSARSAAPVARAAIINRSSTNHSRVSS